MKPVLYGFHNLEHQSAEDSAADVQSATLPIPGFTNPHDSLSKDSGKNVRQLRKVRFHSAEDVLRIQSGETSRVRFLSESPETTPEDVTDFISSLSLCPAPCNPETTRSPMAILKNLGKFLLGITPTTTTSTFYADSVVHDMTRDMTIEDNNTTDGTVSTMER